MSRYFVPLWRQRIYETLCDLQYNLEDDRFIVANKPPDMSMGDIAFPMFPVAAALKRGTRNGSPSANHLAECIAKKLGTCSSDARVESRGPYVNVFLDRASESRKLITDILTAKDAFGRTRSLSSRKIMIEFSGPNTNKPLHVGHLRNDAIGESMARIFSFCGAEVRKVNIINDRGMHICKSMLAYAMFGNGSTPTMVSKKGDHFVGDYYVKYAQWAEQEERAGDEVQKMLIAWEKGDEKTRSLWNKMNKWAIDGIEETYKETGISFDAVYKESDTYLRGKEFVEHGLEKGAFFRGADDAVWADLSDIHSDKKIVLRADGTSVYITQDLALAFMRYADWPFDEMVYVVAREQNYHFKVLFHLLKKLGFPSAGTLHHLEYGMVFLPGGRMKSREGTVVDADTLLDLVSARAEEEITKRKRDDFIEDVKKTARDIALAAVHYYLLSVNAKKDITFDTETALSFHGNTGPYVLYTCARIRSMLAKFRMPPDSQAGWCRCVSDEEWKLIVELSRFEEMVQDACGKRDPSIVAHYLHDCATAFATLYQNLPIATDVDEERRAVRMRMAQAVVQVLKNGMKLLNIPFVEIM